jgi:hypothetical protein
MVSAGTPSMGCMDTQISPETSERALLQGQIEFFLQRAAECAGPDVVAALQRRAQPGCELVSDDVHRFAVGGCRRSVRWERAWKLVTWLGILVRVDLVVAEEEPRILRARIDGALIAECDLADAAGWRCLAGALRRELEAVPGLRLAA